MARNGVLGLHSIGDTGAGDDFMLQFDIALAGKYHTLVNGDEKRVKMLHDAGVRVIGRRKQTDPNSSWNDDDCDNPERRQSGAMWAQYLHHFYPYPEMILSGINEAAAHLPDRTGAWLIDFMLKAAELGHQSCIINSFYQSPETSYWSETAIKRVLSVAKETGSVVGAHKGFTRSLRPPAALNEDFARLLPVIEAGVGFVITEYVGSYGPDKGWKYLYPSGAAAVAELRTGAQWIADHGGHATLYSFHRWNLGDGFEFDDDSDKSRDFRAGILEINRTISVRAYPVTQNKALPAAGDTRWKAVVASANGDFVNVRSTPTSAGITNKVGEIRKNQSISIITDDAAAVVEGSNVWRPVKLLTGIIGWASVAVFTFAPANSAKYIMKDYFFPDAGVEVRHRFSSDEVIYTFRGTDGRSYIGKNTQWEQGWTEIINGTRYLMRGFDISNYLNPNANTVYALFREEYHGPTTLLGDEWVPDEWDGKPFFRHAWVQVFTKTGTPIAAGSGWADTWIRIKKHHASFTTFHGKTFTDVLEVQYAPTADFSHIAESYFVARGHSYVEWTDGVMHTDALPEISVRVPGSPITLGWWNMSTIKQPVGEATVPTPTTFPEPNTQPQQVKLRAGGSVNLRPQPTTAGSTPLLSVPGGADLVIKYPTSPIVRDGYTWVWTQYGIKTGWIAVTTSPMFISATAHVLSVPYASQWGHASKRTGLCGPASSFMLLAYQRKARGRNVPAEITVDSIANHIGMPDLRSFSSIEDNMLALRDYGVEAVHRLDLTWEVIKSEIDAGRPCEVLINYGKMTERVDQNFTLGHIAVVVGYDELTQLVYLNDPDYAGTAGLAKAYKLADFKTALTVSNPGNRPTQGITLKEL